MTIYVLFEELDCRWHFHSLWANAALPMQLINESWFILYERHLDGKASYKTESGKWRLDPHDIRGEVHEVIP